MKGGVGWYLSAEVDTVPRLLQACSEEGLALSNPASRRITYLDDREGREGEQVTVSSEQLLRLLVGRLRDWGDLTFQLWIDVETDVVCAAKGVERWQCYSLWFKFDGLSPAEGKDAAERLFRARSALDAETVLWIEDRVGMAVEYGAPHEWDGSHAPGWPPPSRL